MDLIIIATAVFLWIALAFLAGYSVGTLIGTSAAEARVVDYVNSHPSGEMIRMADRLYAEKKFLHPAPWGTDKEIPEEAADPCTFPGCGCQTHLRCGDDRFLFN